MTEASGGGERSGGGAQARAEEHGGRGLRAEATDDPKGALEQELGIGYLRAWR